MTSLHDFSFSLRLDYNALEAGIMSYICLVHYILNALILMDWEKCLFDTGAVDTGNISQNSAWYSVKTLGALITISLGNLPAVSSGPLSKREICQITESFTDQKSSISRKYLYVFITVPATQQKSINNSSPAFL